MDQAGVVEVIDRVGELARGGSHSVRVLPAPRDEVHAAHELHREEHLPVDHRQLVQPHEVGMRHRAGDPELVFERAEVRRVGQVLEGEALPAGAVFDLVHDRARAPSELAEDVERAERRRGAAERDGRGWRRNRDRGLPARTYQLRSASQCAFSVGFSGSARSTSAVNGSMAPVVRA